MFESFTLLWIFLGTRLYWPYLLAMLSGLGALLARVVVSNHNSKLEYIVDMVRWKSQTTAFRIGLFCHSHSVWSRVVNISLVACYRVWLLTVTYLFLGGGLQHIWGNGMSRCCWSHHLSRKSRIRKRRGKFIVFLSKRRSVESSERLVSKGTEVPCRRRSEIVKFGIRQVDIKGQICSMKK